MKLCRYDATHQKKTNEHLTPASMNISSVSSLDAPLVVNCAGTLECDHPFLTDNRSGREDYYLMFVAGGSLTVTLEGKEKLVGSGTALLFPPQKPYRYRFDGKGEPLFYYWVHFTGSDVARLLSTLSMEDLPLAFDATSSPHTVTRFRTLLDIFAERADFFREELAAALYRILCGLARAKNGSGTKRNPIFRSLSYIHNSFAEELHIPDLARMENLSNSRYHTIFREVTGLSPVRYITRLRLQNACELLESTDMAIGDIGAAVGYEDPHFFSKLFKSNVGVSPKQYRRGDTSLQ